MSTTAASVQFQELIIRDARKINTDFFFCCCQGGEMDPQANNALAISARNVAITKIRGRGGGTSAGGGDIMTLICNHH